MKTVKTEAEIAQVRSLDITEIASLVRRDIAAAVKGGRLPKIKTSIRIARFSGGQSLTITVSKVPDGFVVDNHVKREAWLTIAGNTSWSPGCPGRYTPAAQGVLDTLEEISDQYNWDFSDSQSDHYDVNFYGHIRFNLPVVAERTFHLSIVR